MTRLLQQNHEGFETRPAEHRISRQRLDPRLPKAAWTSGPALAYARTLALTTPPSIDYLCV